MTNNGDDRAKLEISTLGEANDFAPNAIVLGGKSQCGKSGCMEVSLGGC